MTPLAFIQELVEDLIRSHPMLPAPPAHAQTGDLVVDCPGVFATVLQVTEYDLGGNCGFIQMADLTVIAARDCSFVSNEDGTTDWAKQDVVSAQQNLDEEMLWEWGQKHRAEAFAPTTGPSVAFMNSGGLALTTLILQLPVP